MSFDQVDSQQSLTDHLTELRSRLIRSVLAVFAAGFACFYFSEKLFDVIRAPILPFLAQDGLVFTGVMDKFMAHLKISFTAGLVLSAPIWLYQVWKFVAPGLYSHEKKYTLSFIFSGSLLFLLGVGFAYFVFFPTAFEYLLAFGGTVDKPMITIDQYLSFVLTMTIAFGAIFELPLALVMLGMIGIIDDKFLREKRRYAIVLNAVLSAVITPTPDMLSMFMVMVPMAILYEISIFLVAIFATKRREALSDTDSQ